MESGKNILNPSDEESVETNMNTSHENVNSEASNSSVDEKQKSKPKETKYGYTIVRPISKK